MSVFVTDKNGYAVGSITQAECRALSKEFDLKYRGKRDGVTIMQAANNTYEEIISSFKAIKGGNNAKKNSV